ncbi:glucan endo-1,3-beta-glucosidase 8-like [Salvia miltiorrhiza]|uniref:glucan endo-1,3-beta-glucosidase 8-like n=1 Tax=Salvia miltiorrhiza TaxID=226208 RepID=UPI0025ABE82D|nr:glucan endo-1,3-beta-glucosidase 8-like [Salvia miltiorrhiza]
MASKTIPLVYLLTILIARKGVDATIGVNWGRESAQRLIPSQVVDLLLQNGVREARVYTSREDLLRAFSGSGIGLTLTVTDLAILQDYEGCKKWVLGRMPYFNVSTVRRVYVGNYPFIFEAKDKPKLKRTIDVLYNMQKALNDAEWGHQIKVTFTHASAELKPNFTKPSEAEFRDEIKPELAATLRFLEENDAPFVVDMVPSFHLEEYKLDPLFAFVGESTQVIKDVNGAVYTNVFEFMYDAFVWALIKLKAPKMKVVVGQVGWPTDGYTRGNSSIAERFFKGLLPYVSSNKGTPLRPGAPIDTFVHALTDENKLPAYFMRHWGIYRSNGKPKFKIDLTGQGRDIYPTSAKGIMRMPERWCVFNANWTDQHKVIQQLNYACKNTDCSSLKPGGSCDKVGFNTHLSFAFNMYFQFNFQDEKACDFDGLSFITVANPSTPNCMFPIEVVRGQQENYVPAALQIRNNPKAKGYHHTPNCGVSLFLLSLLLPFFWN